MHRLRFLKEFLQHPGSTWAIAESSTGLAELITDAADLPHASVVVEFGSGTGVFTEKILEKVSVDASAIALEINPSFVKETRRRCPQATVFHDSAINTARYLKSAGVEQCDRIICGLPWACFSHSLQDQLLDTVQEVLTERVTRTIDGTEVTRDADPDNPAYLIEQEDGDRVLKSESELSTA